MKSTSSHTLLFTGGLGYIGSHIISVLTQSFSSTPPKILIVDNLSNSSLLVLDRLHQLLPPNLKDLTIDFKQADVLNLEALDSIFKEREEKGFPIKSVIHLAAKKAVGESVALPLLYYENNFVGTLNVLKCMEKYGCRRFIFSSTATVYGCNDNCKEDSPINPLHPYSSTKVCMEYVLRDIAARNEKNCSAEKKEDSVLGGPWKVIILRYFNPAGAHPSGLIGDSPTIFPNNLFPFVEQVAVGRREKLTVFGKDYKTKDGTGVRDYIHVMDLARAHVKALEKLEEIEGHQVYNIGSAVGYSVLDILKTYSSVVGKEIPYVFGERRMGDVDALICNCEKAERELGFKIELSLEDICRDSYNFVKVNPDGIK